MKLSDAYLPFDLVAASKGSVFLLDGGTGEELFVRGVPDDRKIWSASAVVRPQYHPILQDVHRAFLTAGAQAITTNSYGIVPGVGFSKAEIDEYCATAGRLAREVVTTFVDGSVPCSSPLVFGSVGPLIESYRPDKVLPRGQGVKVYSQMIAALAPHVDAILAETLSSTEEAMQVVEALESLRDEYCLPIIISYSLDAAGNLRSGDAVIQALPRIIEFCHDHNVRILALCFNCCEPEAITSALRTIQIDTVLCRQLDSQKILLGAYANRLTPIAKDWTLSDSAGPQPMREDLDPEQYVTKYVSMWIRELNVKVVGGCCGMSPRHITCIKEHFLIDKADEA